MFCSGSGHFLGLVVSKEVIRLDPLKVKAILDLPPPSNLMYLQRLQGKAKFLRGFIPNYVELAKGFTHLLKKGVPFHWIHFIIVVLIRSYIGALLMRRPKKL